MRILICLYLVTWASAGVIDDLPHCSRSTVMEGEVSGGLELQTSTESLQEKEERFQIREYDNSGRPKIFSAVHLSMALHEVACMTIKVSSPNLRLAR